MSKNFKITITRKNGFTTLSCKPPDLSGKEITLSLLIAAELLIDHWSETDTEHLERILKEEPEGEAS
jgi:hypothetical protein